MFTQAGKVGIARKTGKRSIFRNWTEKARKWYTFSHRRLEKLQKYFSNWELFSHSSIVTTVSNDRFRDFWLYKMTHKQHCYHPTIANISKSKGLVGLGPDKIESRFFTEKSDNDQDFCWACNFNPSIFSTWMASQICSFQICRVFPPARILGEFGKFLREKSFLLTLIIFSIKCTCEWQNDKITDSIFLLQQKQFRDDKRKTYSAKWEE